MPEEIQELCDLIKELSATSVSRKKVSAVEKAYVSLGKALGVAHLLACDLPETAPDDGLRLPDVAPECYQRRTDHAEKPAAFIARVYRQWLGHGLTQAHLLHLDRPLYHALHNWLRQNDMPDWLDLPSKKQMIDRELAEKGVAQGETLAYPALDPAIRRRLKYYNAARNRARKKNRE